eukprot:1181703-Prorocentrum_minimum.AAC.4
MIPHPHLYPHLWRRAHGAGAAAVNVCTTSGSIILLNHSQWVSGVLSAPLPLLSQEDSAHGAGAASAGAAGGGGDGRGGGVPRSRASAGEAGERQRGGGAARGGAAAAAAHDGRAPRGPARLGPHHRLHRRRGARRPRPLPCRRGEIQEK